MSVQIRLFEERDYPNLVALANAICPDQPTTLEEMQYYHRTWDYSRYVRLCFVAEGEQGQLLGWSELRHSPWAFHPRRYSMRLGVASPARRRGVGTALYERLLVELHARDAELVRCTIQESEVAGVAFLLKRGFREVDRTWESRLDVRSFDFAPFAGAYERVAAQGIAITMLAAELERDSAVLRQVYELDCACGMDAPSLDPPTFRPFELWARDESEKPGALPEAWFLAKDSNQFVGISSLQRAPALPEVLWVNFTGVRRECRGRGIAMALKLESIRYARAHGYREIRTENNALNRPMLRINEALGFGKQPAWITLEKILAP
jgi:GNAT superfamily N-acetyltransferase